MLSCNCPSLPSLLLLLFLLLLPLMLVCSTYDDPGLPCALLPLSFFWKEHTHHRNRWTMCAKDICFTNEFFRWGQAGHQQGPLVTARPTPCPRARACLCVRV